MFFVLACVRFAWYNNLTRGDERKAMYMIIYDKLFERLRTMGKNEYWLRLQGISPTILAKIKTRERGLDYRTINRLCKIMDCQPGDLMEYVPDDE